MSRVQRRLRVLSLLAAGSIFGVASSCDPAVRTTVFGGLQAFATSLVAAFFQSIEISNGVTPTGVDTTSGSPTPDLTSGSLDDTTSGSADDTTSGSIPGDLTSGM